MEDKIEVVFADNIPEIVEEREDGTRVISLGKIEEYLKMFVIGEDEDEPA